jgi:Holliday junction resolvase RusA-like endonuclease
MVQKNSKQIIWAKRYPFQRSPRLIDKPKVIKWRKDITSQARAQWAGKDPLTGDLGVIVVAYLGKRQRPDVDNLAAGPLDAIEKAGVVENDRQFSFAVIIRRTDWEDPRVEVFVTEAPRLSAAILGGGALLEFIG